MFLLSIKAPWSISIYVGTKRIENRTYSINSKYRNNEYIALQCSSTFNDDEISWYHAVCENDEKVAKFKYSNISKMHGKIFAYAKVKEVTYLEAIELDILYADSPESQKPYKYWYLYDILFVPINEMISCKGQTLMRQIPSKQKKTESELLSQLKSLLSQKKK